MHQTVIERPFEDQRSSISRHLNNRQQLIVVIMKLFRAIEEQHLDLEDIHLGRFCNELVDYLSNAHFNLYLSAFPPPRDAPREYAILETTTRTAMAFNESWGSLPAPAPSQLRPALARVTLALETHFEMEDELLDLKLAEKICA